MFLVVLTGMKKNRVIDGGQEVRRVRNGILRSSRHMDIGRGRLSVYLHRVKAGKALRPTSYKPAPSSVTQKYSYGNPASETWNETWYVLP